MPCERKHVEAIRREVNNCAGTLIVRHELNAAFSDALAACDESPWRSMESLKADGRNVLLLFSKNDPHIVVGNRWKDFLILHESGEREATVVADGWMPLPAATEVST